MRNTLVTTWILSSLSCFGGTQNPERVLTPAELQAALEADLHGAAEAMFGSDRAAQWNRIVEGTPFEKNRAIVESLHLPSPPRPSVVAAGTVSVARLRHSIPKPAVKDFNRARKLAASGKLLEAAQELEKALTLDPDFQEAQENLGGLYLKLGRPAHAEPHLRRAIELDPSSSNAHANLSAVQLLRGDTEAAERTARRALELSASNDWARFVLGISLLPKPENRAEALLQLEKASRSVPVARQALTALQAK